MPINNPVNVVIILISPKISGGKYFAIIGTTNIEKNFSITFPRPYFKLSLNKILNIYYSHMIIQVLVCV